VLLPERLADFVDRVRSGNAPAQHVRACTRQRVALHWPQVRNGLNFAECPPSVDCRLGRELTLHSWDWRTSAIYCRCAGSAGRRLRLHDPESNRLLVFVRVMTLHTASTLLSRSRRVSRRAGVGHEPPPKLDDKLPMICCAISDWRRTPALEDHLEPSGGLPAPTRSSNEAAFLIGIVTGAGC
jgi:hypothetical protein